MKPIKHLIPINNDVFHPIRDYISGSISLSIRYDAMELVRLSVASSTFHIFSFLHKQPI